jgi:hypothetical protein
VISSLRKFQCDNGLDVTSDCDHRTQRKLVEVHGA